MASIIRSQHEIWIQANGDSTAGRKKDDQAQEKKLPHFKTTEEAARFWDTHSSLDYLDDMEEVELKVDPSIKRPRDLSPRCPLDDEVLLSRYIDMHLGRDHVKLEKIEELYCRKCHYVRLASESERLVREIEATLKRMRAKSHKVFA